MTRPRNVCHKRLEKFVKIYCSYKTQLKRQLALLQDVITRKSSTRHIILLTESKCEVWEDVSFYMYLNSFDRSYLFVSGNENLGPNNVHTTVYDART